MSRRFCIVALTVLMIACASGVVFSQMSGSPGKEFNEAFYAELKSSEEELVQFGLSLQPLFTDMQQNAQAKAMAAVMERAKDTSSPMTQEEGLKLGLGAVMEGMVGMQKPINDKATEFFSEEGRQKLHLRLFQLKEGLLDRLGTTDSMEATQAAFSFDIMQLMGGQPDFLELHPEQQELITKQQKETTLEAMTLVQGATIKMITAHPEKLAEIQQLAKEFGEAQTDEEREKIAKQVQDFQVVMMKDIAPELKAIFLKGREDFYRVLTDAQKAKIKAVMADMPDYMKKLLAEVDKEGGALSGLNSWVPGTGAPGVNPNREAPRQRTNTGGRTFPGN